MHPTKTSEDEGKSPPMVQWTLAVSYFLHLVATVTWIGGMALMLLVVWPTARSLLAAQDESGTLLRFFEQLRKRFTPFANLSLIVLLVTGLVQMELDPHYDGLLQITSDWSRAILFKHVAVLGMIVVGGLMQWQINPALERASLLARRGKDTPELPALQRRERQLTALNLALGVIVLLFTAVATSI